MQKLSIENFMGAKFPRWLLELKVHNLVEISLINCRRCEILPPLSQLHHLKVLTIQGKPNLEKWSSDDLRQMLPHIKKLTIKSCPKLTQLPHLPSLETLRLMGCNQMLLMSLVACTAITQLDIGGFRKLTSSPGRIAKE